MREHGILFSAPMVRAIMEGRKTQMRLLMKFIPLEPGLNLHASSLVLQTYFKGHPESGYVLASRGAGSCWNNRTKTLLPTYTVGDRLWVREAWRTGGDLDNWSALKIQEEAEASGCRIVGSKNPCCPIYYEADGAHRVWTDSAADDVRDFGKPGRYRPALSMPRWASRITLEVTAVRAQRLQDISEEDAIAEGVSAFPHDPEGDCWTDGRVKTAYEYLWGQLHGWTGEKSWAANPYVWAYTFKRLEGGAK